MKRARHIRAAQQRKCCADAHSVAAPQPPGHPSVRFVHIRTLPGSRSSSLAALGASVAGRRRLSSTATALRLTQPTCCAPAPHGRAARGRRQLGGPAEAPRGARTNHRGGMRRHAPASCRHQQQRGAGGTAATLAAVVVVVSVAALLPCRTAAAAAARPPAPYVAKAPPCNQVPGLCDVPLTQVLFGGTHNSHAIRTTLPVFDNQDLGFAAQLQQGVRLFDLDYSGGSGGRLGHCVDCFCGFAQNASDASAAAAFGTMGDFLAANPRDVIVLGLSNINCAPKGVAAARDELLAALGASSLSRYLATSALQPDTTLGQLVASNQRAILLFYDQWGGRDGYVVAAGGAARKWVPRQPLIRFYGEGTTVDASGAAQIAAQAPRQLAADLARQFLAAAGGSSAAASVPFRVAGWFPTSCFACRAPGQCGPISCALAVNREAAVTYVLGNTTAAWLAAPGGGSSSRALIPAFNGIQVDYFQQPLGEPGVAALVRRVNNAAAWLHAEQPAAARAGLGLASCVWVLDDAACSGLLLCVHDGRTPATAGSSGRRRVLVPANSQLTLSVFRQGGAVAQTVRGSGDRVQVVPVAGPFTALQLTWGLQ